MQILLTKYVFISSLLQQNKEGKIPLHMAAMHGRFTGSQILIQNGNGKNLKAFKMIYSIHLYCYSLSSIYESMSSSETYFIIFDIMFPSSSLHRWGD